MDKYSCFEKKNIAVKYIKLVISVERDTEYQIPNFMENSSRIHLVTFIKLEPIYF